MKPEYMTMVVAGNTTSQQRSFVDKAQKKSHIQTPISKTSATLPQHGPAALTELGPTRITVSCKSVL